MSTVNGVALDELLALPSERRLSHAREVNDPGSYLGGLIDEANRLVISDLSRALTATSALVELADGIGDPGSRTQSRRAHAHAMAYANRFDDAGDVLKEALEIAERSGELLAAGEVRMAMLHVLNRQGRSAEAIEAGLRALDTFKEAGADVLAAKTEANLGVVYRTRNEPARALDMFDRAKTVLGADPVAAAQLDSNRAEALLELSRFAEAEEAFNAALGAFETAGLTRGVAIVEGNLADLMSRKAALRPALRHFERARRLMSEIESPGDVARLDAEEAEALLATGLRRDAVEAFMSAVPRLDEHGLVLEAARARTALAQTLIELGRHDEAGSALARAAEGFETVGHGAGTGRVELLQARVACARGTLDEAERHLESAMQSLHDRPSELAVARRELAMLAFRQGRTRVARAAVQDAIGIASRFDLAPLLSDLLVLRARMHLAEECREDALADLRAAVEQIERVRGSLQADRLRTAFAGSRTDAYELLTETLLANGDLDAAFETVEKGKSRTLLDLVAGAISIAGAPAGGAADPAEQVLVDDVTTLRGELNGLYSRLYDLRAPADAKTLEGWHGQIESCERRLRRAERRLSATQAGGVYAPTIDRATAAALLPSDTALVEYTVADGRLHAFVIRNGAIAAFRNLGEIGALTELVNRLRFQVNRVATYPPYRAGTDASLVDSARRALGALYDRLLAPLDDALSGVAHLHVVPHGALHRVPFPALWDGAQYVLDRCSVTCSPSASILVRLAEGDGVQGEPTALVMGVSDEAAPRIADEVESVAAMMPKAACATGAAATIERFKSDAPQASLIHLACHGRFEPEDPMSSGLKLADGWLTIRDLYAMRLRRPLVVLSGCDTGAAAVESGDELVGLIHGFIAAGASTLLMTLWPLHDETARVFMQTLHEALGAAGTDGDRVAGALRTAQIALRERCPHPAFWAPFVLHGGRFATQEAESGPN